MTGPDPQRIERRTQEIGRDLLRCIAAQRRPLSARIPDELFDAIMSDDATRTSMLRLADILARAPRAARTASIVREYLSAPDLQPPALLRLPLWLSRRLPNAALAWTAKRAVGVMAARFIVDATPKALEATLVDLTGRGRGASVDVLGEAVLSDEEADAYRDRYLDLIATLAKHSAVQTRTAGGFPTIELSLKLSSLTPRFNPVAPDATLADIRPRLLPVLEAARAVGIGIAVDAEQYRYRELTWHVFRETLHNAPSLDGWSDVGVVVQAYHRDAASHLDDIATFAESRGSPIRVRLVKGAYWDEEAITAAQNGWPMPVFLDKADTDINFESLVYRALERRDAVALAVASHNARSHAYAQAVAESLGHAPASVEHQTLYRTWTAMSNSLGEMGWPARDYVPMGEPEPGMAYLVRRILENSSQVGFLSRSREQLDPTSLLAPPHRTTADQRYIRPPHPTGFANVPEARLFDAGERSVFAAALNKARAQWGKQYPIVIGGVQVGTGTFREDRSPSHPNGPAVGYVEEAGQDVVERAIDVTTRAQPAWAARDPSERADVLQRAADRVDGRKAELGSWVVHEAGRSWTEAIADVEEAADHLSWAAHEVRRPDRGHDYAPRGLVACIPPWNFPLALAAGMIGAALATGNAVILKPASETPITARMLVDILHEAGVPQDVLACLPGGGSTVGRILVDSPLVDMVAFTGSVEVGLDIYQRAAQVVTDRGHLKRVVAEMGGKNAIVVFPEADIDDTVRAVLKSAFSHAGQKCSACSRAIVHRDIADRFVARLVAAASALPCGPADDPATIVNPVISPAACERIAEHQRKVRSEAEVLLDSKHADSTCIVSPMIVRLPASASSASYAAQVELFAPILTVIEFADEDEAVRLANDTPYGLTLGVFSYSSRTIERLARECAAGNVYVNRGITGARVGIEPFGGMALSGTGPKAGSEQYLRAFEVRDQMPLASGDAQAIVPGPASFPHELSLGPWPATSLDERKRILLRGLDLVRQRGGPSVDKAMQVLAASGEITIPSPTVRIPGQRNEMSWAIPRGVGLVAVDGSWPLDDVCAYVTAALLVGNALVLHAHSPAVAAVEALARALVGSGVPQSALVVAAHRDLLGLASAPVQFAIAAARNPRLRDLYAVVASTRIPDRHWVTALLVAGEGPEPGEPGFLYRFVLPKVIAVNTMRHGADLGANVSRR